jgi:hypothetical protein
VVACSPRHPAPARTFGRGATSSLTAAAAAPVAPSPSAARWLSPPTLLRLPALQVSAPVVAVGVAADGQMAIPDDIRTVGWYRWSALPGAARGSTVIAGHVDSATQGLGSLFRLRTVRAGAAVLLRTADGRTHRYHVVALQSYLKTQVPLASVFSLTGAPRLVIVTCGGAFDRETRSYESNIVVTAVSG